ncbi:hypothetical protein VTJ83DRAFT_5648 [Remersonia thermophila]|uniref:Coenzyme Q-binding protein COQ10 START domain-containing protein n=1 Tax=Remersonia thermophila TaxID=72144 RepID=A0ABR4D7K0_9PEZI
MAPRLSPTTRRLLLRPRHIPPPLLLSSPAPPTPPLTLLQPPTTRLPTRLLATTHHRPFLLSALSNLTPGLSPDGRPPPPKTLRARRVLPYPPDHLYTLIADIDSYRHFLPHCPHSLVTHWTKPQPPPPSSPSPPSSQQQQQQQKAPTRHPARADLTVGWGPFTQTYTSRVYCIPGSVVEAVSGAAETTIPWETLRAVGYDPAADQEHALRTMEGIFESLVTRWAVRPFAGSRGAAPEARAGEGRVGGETAPAGWTEVTLSVTFQFKNPALGFAVGQLADEKVDEMVKAFEGRARALYGAR